MKTQSKFHKHIFQDKQASSDQEQQSSSLPERQAWLLGGGVATDLASRVPAAAWMSYVMPRLSGAPTTLEDRRLMRGLKDRAIAQRVSIDYGPQRGKGNIFKNFFSPHPSSFYKPYYRAVTLNKGTRGPGLLAHELGHAEGSKALIGSNLIGKTALPYFMSGTLLADNKDKAKNWATASLLPAAGLMASELDASRRGYRMMRGLGAGRMKSLTSFAGIPTYALSSSIPWLSYWLKSGAGGYKEPKH